MSKAFETALSGLFRAILAGVAVGALAGSADAWAFGRSEEEMMKIDVQEAKARARDFKRHQERMARVSEERERAVNEIRKKRERDEAAAEALREKYLKVRPDYDKEQAKRDKLEVEFERKKADQERQLDQVRYDYLKKREKVRKTIESEAFIDEAEEYEIKPF